MKEADKSDVYQTRLNGVDRTAEDEMRIFNSRTKYICRLLVVW